MLINEVQRLKIGFQTLEYGGSDELRSSSNFIYFENEARSSHILLALQKTKNACEWMQLESNLSGLGNRDRFAYKAGPIYEAESGTRLVKGKRLTAEMYLKGLRDLPVVDLSQCTDHRLDIAVWIYKQDEKRLKDNGRFHGYVYEESAFTKIEKGNLVQILVPIVTLNNLRVAAYAPPPLDEHIDGPCKQVLFRKIGSPAVNASGSPSCISPSESLSLF